MPTASTAEPRGLYALALYRAFVERGEAELGFEPPEKAAGEGLVAAIEEFERAGVEFPVVVYPFGRIEAARSKVDRLTVDAGDPLLRSPAGRYLPASRQRLVHLAVLLGRAEHPAEVRGFQFALWMAQHTIAFEEGRWPEVEVHPGALAAVPEDRLMQWVDEIAVMERALIEHSLLRDALAETEEATAERIRDDYEGNWSRLDEFVRGRLLGANLAILKRRRDVCPNGVVVRSRSRAPRSSSPRVRGSRRSAGRASPGDAASDDPDEPEPPPGRPPADEEGRRP